MYFGIGLTNNIAYSSHIFVVYTKKHRFFVVVEINFPLQIDQTREFKRQNRLLTFEWLLLFAGV